MTEVTKRGTPSLRTQALALATSFHSHWCIYLYQVAARRPGEGGSSFPGQQAFPHSLEASFDTACQGGIRWYCPVSYLPSKNATIHNKTMANGAIHHRCLADSLPAVVNRERVIATGCAKYC